MADSRRIWTRLLIQLGLLVLGVAALHRWGYEADWTADARFSLDPALVAVVRSRVDAPIELVGVWPTDLGGEAGRLLRRLEGQVRRIAALEPRLSFRLVDLLRDEPGLDALSPAVGRLRTPHLVLVRGERGQRIPITAGTLDSLQREVAGALIAVTTAHRPPVFLLQGHDELPWAGPDGCAALRQRLTLTGCEVGEPLDEARLTRWGRIPDEEGAVVVIAGPTRPLGADTLAALAAHVRNGHGLLVLADDRCPDDLALWLRSFGLEVAGGWCDRPEQLLDPQAPPGSVRPGRVVHSLVFSDGRELDRLLLTAQAGLDGSAAPLAPVRSSARPVVASRSTPVRSTDPATLKGQPRCPPRRTAMTLAGLPQPEAWVASPGDRQLPVPLSEPEARQLAPISLAAAIQLAPDPASAHPGREARLAIWGSRRLAESRQVEDPRLANAELLEQLVAWLAQRDPPAAVPMQRFAQYTLSVSRPGLRWVWLTFVAALPLLCLGAAILAWWDRR